MIDLRTEQDPDAVLRSMPDRILLFHMYSPQSSDVKLTVAGLRHCSDPTARDDLVFFLRCVQWFAERQKSHIPSSSQDTDEPHASGTEASRALSQDGVGPGAGHARRLFWFIEQDNNLWGGGSLPTPDHDWDVAIPERVRIYRGITSIDDYLSRYQKSVAPKPAAPMFTLANPPAEEKVVVTEAKAIFVVHGRDMAAKYEVAHFLGQSTGLQPIILDEQASSGRTLIEKFEHHANGVRYAVVLLTSDDVGRAKDEEHLRPRARQNVVFELGYFFAHLERRNVAVLLDDGVERPADIDGLVYIKRDTDGGWKTKLAKELNEAGIPTDPTKA
jgi:predicted nucleotide-binding protein